MQLTLDKISVSFGKVTAIKAVSLTLQAGQFITLIGSNGAGKSTILRAISRLEKLKSGVIKLDEKRIDTQTPDAIVKLGISHVPEGRRIFTTLSVIENLKLGAFTRHDKTQINQDLERIFTLFPRLKDRRQQLANTMSGGEQQMLSIARALMSKPSILLLDEPSLGLAPIIVQEIGQILLNINQSGVGVILVEQNADLALHLAQYAYVIETGEITLADKAKSLIGNDHIKKAYLGI